MPFPLTILADPEPERTPDLAAWLDELGADVEGQKTFAWPKIPSVHFLRFLVLDQAPFDAQPKLAFESNYDGELHAHLHELLDAGLGKVWAFCPGWPATREAQIAWLTDPARMRPTAAFHVGCHGLTRRMIENDARVRDKLQAWLDANRPPGGWAGVDEDTLYRRIVEGVLPDPTIVIGAHGTLPVPGFWTMVAKYVLPVFSILLAGGIFLPLVTAIVGGAFVAALATGVFTLRWLEAQASQGQVRPAPAPRDQVKKYASREDHLVQNQLTHLVAIKPGWLRLLALRVTLWIIDRLAKYVYTDGELGNIASIHFGRWVIVGDRLLFFSNYDGSWESYLGDFVDRNASGLTSVWGHTAEFPPTEWLLGKGAEDEEWFKEWARRHQIHTHLWYAAYPELTVENILNNARVREQLGEAMTDGKLHDWLRRL